MATFPKELMQWLASLPETNRVRETMIAERNLLRIQNHLSK